ncbi:MAG: hypothetical protein ACK4WC_05855 [Rubrimonas sp.]
MRALLATLLSAGLAGAAQAGAWTQDRGAVFASLSGDVRDGVWTAATYAEWGALDALTLGGGYEVAQRDGAAEPDGQASAFARVRLWTGPDGDPLSVQITGFRAVKGREAPDAPERDLQDAVDLRAMYGRGFDGPLGPGWLNVELGHRWRLGRGADEWRADLTAGVRPLPRALVYAQSFSTIGRRNNDAFGGDYDAHKLALNAGYALTPRFTAVLGAEREVAGRNIDRATRFKFSLWARF